MGGRHARGYIGGKARNLYTLASVRLRGERERGREGERGREREGERENGPNNTKTFYGRACLFGFQLCGSGKFFPYFPLRSASTFPSTKCGQARDKDWKRSEKKRERREKREEREERGERRERRERERERKRPNM